ncbi:MAG: hypothetical protein ACPGID_03265, partial [Rubricella sp.]
EGSRRRSVDLNIADAGLSVGDLPGLKPLLDAMGLNRRKVGAIFQKPLGHFAAGRGADGTPFVTFYYGARPL